MAVTDVLNTGFKPRWNLMDRLRKAREHAGLNQQELADAIGRSRRSIAGYESGRTVPDRPVLMSWALTTGVDYDWLTEESDESSAQVSAGIKKCRFTSYGLVSATRSAYRGDPFGGLVRAAA